NEFRYLNPTYRGEARVEYMPDDREFNGKERYAYFLAHSQTLPQHGMSAQLNLNRVSDNTYFTDLATRIGLTSTVLLPNDLTLAKSGYWAGNSGSYVVSAFAQHWQTLQPDPTTPLTPPYNRVPQFALAATRPDWLMTDFDLQA